MADKKNIIPIKIIWVIGFIVMATTVAKFTVPTDNWLLTIAIWCVTFITFLGLFGLKFLRDELIEEWKNSYDGMKAFLQKIAPFKKEVFIDAALEDKGIAKDVEWMLLKKYIGSALINNIVEDVKTNNDLQKTKVIVTLYCDNPSTNWIGKRLEIYLKHQVSAKLVNQSLKILVCTTQEKKAKTEEYITNNVRNLNIEVVKLGEKQDYEKLLSVIRKKLRE